MTSHRTNLTAAETSVLAEAESVVSEAEQRAVRLGCRRGRLLLALDDLGLLQVVGRDWISIGDGFEFGVLDDRATDRLTVLVEDIAAALPARSAAAGPGQLSFEFPTDGDSAPGSNGG